MDLAGLADILGLKGTWQQREIDAEERNEWVVQARKKRLAAESAVIAKRKN